MKVCPDCQSRFTGGETFCPNDGTKLVDARELSPGKLTGLSLDDIVSLEELEHSDALGERYRGKLDDGGQQVRVTAFNQAFTPDTDRESELREALDAHADPLPESVLELHSYRLEGDSPFVIEEYPKGPSLRTLLDQRKALDWQTAVRIAANVARTGGYLVEHGVLHSCIHPGGIFITDVEQGRVQLGEWAHGVLSHRKAPLEYADEHPDGFFGYAGYMAPETIRDGKDIDQRSVVYIAGMLLYEMIVGKAPFTSKKSEDTLKRHLHEKPLKLAIAKSGEDLHPELDDVLDMMWVKAPERRFQNQQAAIGALASLFDTTPAVLAPEPEPRQEAVFEGPVPGAPDDNDRNEANDETDAGDDDSAGSDSKTTMMGLPGVGGKDTDDAAEEDEQEETGPEDDEHKREDAGSDENKDQHKPPPRSGPSPSIIIEDPELRSAAAGDEESAEDSDEADEDELPDADADDEDQDEAVDHPERETMLMGGQVSDAQESADRSDDEVEEPAGEDEDAPEDDAEDVDKPQKDTLLMGGDAGWDSLEEELDADPSTDSDDEEEPADHEADERAEAADEATDDDEAQDSEAAFQDEVDEEASEDQEDEGSDETDEAGGTVGQMAAADIGAVEVEGDSGEGMSDDWFGKSHEETWETQQVEAVEQQSETLIRNATIAVFALLALGVLGFFIFVETGDSTDETADADEESVAAANETETSDTREVDLDRLKANFDSAVSGDRLLSPRANSAIKYLEQLKRHGEDSEAYAEARETFVEQARARAEEVQDKQLYAARNLAGAAAQFSDDEELQTFADDLDRKWRASTEADSTDAGGEPDAAASEKVAPSESSGASASTSKSRPDREPERDAPPREPPKSTGGDDSTEPSGDSVSSLLRKADAAQSSGDSATAKRLYRDVLDKSSSNSRALSALGALYFDDAAYSQAAKYYQRAVRSSGGNMSYRLRLGMTYYKLGRFERARDTWQAVLDREPGNARARQYIKLVESKIN